MTGLLLDSHVFLWWAHLPQLLPEGVRGVLADPNNTIQLSMASIWELAIKQSIGKLAIPGNIEDTLRYNGIALMRIELAHIDGVRSLPLHHGDPFDRLLIAQAQAEGLTLVSRDRWFEAYDVSLLRA